MNVSEVTSLIIYIRELWPSYEVPDSDEGWELRTSAWLDIIGDLPAEAVKSAVAEMADREFAPTPGMLRKRLAQEVGGDIPSWDEFWTWARGLAQTASLQLLDDTATVVVCPWPALEGLVTTRTVADWAREELTEHDLEMVTQAHLRRLYAARTERAQREMVPPTPAMVAWRDGVPALNLRAERALDA